MWTLSEDRPHVCHVTEFHAAHARSCDLVVISPGMCRRRHFLETFVEEATLMSRLHHPNLQTLVGQ